MIELDITKQARAYLDDTEPMPLTGSVMQLGDDAGKITWSNAQAANETYSYVTEDNIGYISNYFDDMGMELEPHELSDIGCINAILIQHIDLELKERDFDGEVDIDNNDGSYQGDYTPFFKLEENIYIQL